MARRATPVRPISTPLSGSGNAVTGDIPNLVDIARSLPQHPSARYPTRPLSQITQIIIHHSAVNNIISPERIARMQIAQGKPGIGYHLFISAGGLIYLTNPFTVVSAHTPGHDATGLAVCFAGNFTRRIPTDAQLQAGQTVLQDLLTQFNLPVEAIKGASELGDTQSPGRQWLSGQRWKSRLVRGLQSPATQPGPTPPIDDPPTDDPSTDIPSTDLNARIAALTTQLRQVQAQLTQAQAARQSAEREVARLNTRLAQLEAQLAAKGQNGQAAQPVRVSKPQIQDISTQLPRHDTATYPKRNPDDVDAVVIHHTAVADSVGADRIAAFQVRQGKPGITYHFFIGPDGSIFQTNPIDNLTSHTVGHDQTSIALAVAGNFTNEIPAPAQLESTASLLAYLRRQYGIPTANIKGAGELISTQSPGKQWLQGQNWRKLLLDRLQAIGGSDTEQPPASDESAHQIATLKARIAELEANLSLAQEAILSIGSGSGTQPPPDSTQVVKPPAIIDIIAELPHHPTKRYQTRTTETITGIVLHHSAVAATISADRIATFNVENNDLPGIGYHFFIRADGAIQQTNHLTTIAYHAGQHNATSIGVALAGDFDDAVPTNAQIVAGGHLIAWLIDSLDLPLNALQEHKTFANTSCPGHLWDNGPVWRDRLLAAIQDHLSGAVEPSHPGKALYHYMLFWQTETDWARQDLLNAANYIGKFRPSLGFSVDDAIDAQYVTIIGGPLGISSEAETRIQAAGSKVERVAGNSERATKSLLDNLVARNKRFLTFDD